MNSPLFLSLFVAALVGGTAAYLGSLMISRQMALVGDALGHVALPGMGLALLFGLDPSLGAFAFLLLGIVILWRLEEKTPLSPETLVGVVFVTSLALGFLVVPQPELLESLIGDIARISPAGAAVSAVLCAAVFALVRWIYPGMMLLNISPDLAAVQGVSARRHNFLYLLAIALTVSLGVKVTGSLLVGALVIVPPAAARIASLNLRQYARRSVLAGAASGVAGVLAARSAHFPPGPAIILASAALFAAALLVGRIRGLARCRARSAQY